jgi:D-xylose transport system permease protein
MTVSDRSPEPRSSGPVGANPGGTGLDDGVGTSASVDLPVVGSAELVVDSFGEYVRTWARRVRSGDSGALPVVAGLAVIVIIFQAQQSAFLSVGNLVNLIDQSATFILLGMAEMFALLLGEIDLSLGYLAGLGAAVTATTLGAPFN